MDSTLILGPPGCGKTHTLLGITEKAMEDGIPPDRIAYVSYTRKAVNEAVERAGRRFDLVPKELPYFRTLHSICYRGLGLHQDEVMTTADWQGLGDELGLEINGTGRANPEDGLVLPHFIKGDRYVRMLERARMRRVSLEQEYRETADYEVHFPMLKQVASAVDHWRTEWGKHTFTAMLEQYVLEDMAPNLELVIVDEVQDLVPLQWEVLRVLARRAERVIYAGDDDQAIHRWAGVDVTHIQRMDVNRQVLAQSYRLPQRVWNLSQHMVQRIPGRLEKEFHPREEEGSVSYHLSMDTVPLEEGSWTLMARINGFANEIADWLYAQGYYYMLRDRPSVDKGTLAAIKAWRDLQDGGTINMAYAKKLYGALPKRGSRKALKHGSFAKLTRAPRTAQFTYQGLAEEYGLLAPIEVDALNVLDLGVDEADYIRMLERRGEDLMQPPRIKVSTLHAMKGGEDDNIVVYTGSTEKCVNSMHPEDEDRAFYVGVTRAKEHLHVVMSDKRYTYTV